MSPAKKSRPSPRSLGVNRLLLPLLAVLFLLPSLSRAEEGRLRVLTFNLRYKNSNDKEQTSWDVRREIAADLIGYQEALRPMLDELKTKVEGYEEIGVGREDGKTKGEYSAIWVRRERFTVQDSGTFWLSETPDVPNSMSWGNKITRICTWAKLEDKVTRKIFHFYNLHLDHQSQEARFKGTAQVLKFMESREPAQPYVLTGDFNAGEDNPVVTSIIASPLKPVDSWRRLHPDIVPAESGTFHSFTGKLSEAKIDHIFVPATAKLIDAEIMHFNKDGTYPSDHFPVRATVKWAD